MANIKFLNGLNVTGEVRLDDKISIDGTTNPHVLIHDETNETYTALWSGDTQGALTFNHSSFRITSSAANFTGTNLLTITNAGAIKFNTYGAGTLVSDASGNITVSSGGGAGGPYLPLAGGTLTGDLTLDANSGSSPDIFLKNVSDNFARILFDTSNQFVIKIGTTNEMIMSATATTFDSSITAKSAVLSGPTDGILTLNQTGTDTGWSYINFQTSNVRNYFVGQDSSKNFEIFNDVIDVTGFSMSYTNANITLGADLIVSGGDITLSGTGRIQGVDTVSAGTDAANKTYVDNAVSTGVGAYLPLAGGTMTGNTLHGDNVKSIYGTGNDLQIYHNGTHSNIVNETGDLLIEQKANDGDIKFYSDDGSGNVAQYFRVDGGAVETRFLKSTRHFDDVGAYFGDSADLQLYHDGSNSYISEINTGNLLITSNGASVQINKGTTENMAEFITDGAVNLYYDSAKKFETTSTGVTVTGITLTNSGSSSDTYQGLSTGTNSFIILANSGGNAFAGSTNGSYVIYSGGNANSTTGAGASLGLTIDGSQNATFAGDVTIADSKDFRLGAIMLQDSAAGRLGFNRDTSDGTIHDSGYNAFQIQVAASGASGKLEIQEYNGAGNYAGSTLITGSGITINDYVIHNGDATTKFGFSANDTYVIRTNDVERFSINNSGFALTGGSRVTRILDEDSMFTNSATSLATQQSIKAYVDTTVGNVNTGVLTVSDDGGSTINVSGSATARVVAAVTGTVSSSSANLATGAQIQTAIDTATTGALKFVSEWDASGLNGGSPDLRQTSTHIPGSYYIVSVAGGSSPNGSGTSPSEWAVGDWCVRSDLATDTWQKIDNTQVGNVTGTGSANRLAIWGSNSAITGDSRLIFEPLGMSSRKLSVDGSVFVDAGYVSITADGSNAVTFTESGNGLMTIAAPDDIILDCGSDIVLDTGGNDIRFRVNGVEYGKFKNDSGNFSIYSSIENEDILFKGNDGGSTITALTLDMSNGGSATFRDDIDFGGKLTQTGTGANTFAGTVETTTLRTDVINNKANSANIIYRSGTDTIIGGGSASQKLTLADSGNATFAPTGGVITLGANGHITSKQSLDVATAGGRLIGSSNRGILGQIRIEQTTTSADGGYIALDTCASGSNSPTEKMRIDSSGLVGIGNTSPSSFNSRGRNLVVAGSGDVGITIDSASTGSGTLLFADGTGGTAAYRGSIEYDHADDSMAFSTAAVEALSLNSDQSATFAGDVTLLEDLFATNQNLKFHAGGTHVMNIDVNGKVYPATHNAFDIGHSTSLAWRDIFSSRTIYGNEATFAGTISSGAITSSASITLGNSAYGQLNLKDSGTSYGMLYKYNGDFWIQGAATGNTINFGAPTAFVQNINVNGTMDADNFKINGAQGTSGQVMTSTGSGVQWGTAGGTTTQTVLFVNFSDDSSTTSSQRIPYNSLVETTSNQYYNTFDCPANGTIKRIRMQNTKGTLSTGFTTIFDIWKNSTQTPTQSSSSLTASGGSIEYEPNLSFNKGDRVMIGYRKSAGSKYWRGVSASIIIEFTKV